MKHLRILLVALAAALAGCSTLGLRHAPPIVTADNAGAGTQFLQHMVGASVWQQVNIGTAPNSGNGDPLRTAFTKLNTDFSYVQNMFGGSSVFSSTGAVAASDIVGLFTGCSGTQYLGADGACHSGGGGSGITQLTGDVTAGPGSGSVAATVVRISGVTPSTGAVTAIGASTAMTVAGSSGCSPTINGTPGPFGGLVNIVSGCTGGTATITVTIDGGGLSSYAHGYSCSMGDHNQPFLPALKETLSTSTSATFSIPAAYTTGDIATIDCSGWY